MSASYPSTTPPHRSGQSDIFIRPVNAELIGYTVPQGFGSVREEQRYQDIINDNAETAPNYAERPSDVGGHYYPPPYPPYVASYGDPFKDQPYDDTIVYFHHGKRGVQIVLQANRKMFLAIVILMLVVMNSPGITDLISKLVRSVMGAN
ncbi:MAG: hypothetical protein IT324_00105 [Anaerolineae bacterium]|nr:hypothetical protein [Anaerolineae bacterium]